MVDTVFFYKGCVFLREVGCKTCNVSFNSTAYQSCTHEKKLIDVVGYYGEPKEYPHGRMANKEEINMIRKKYPRFESANA